MGAFNEVFSLFRVLFPVTKQTHVYRNRDSFLRRGTDLDGIVPALKVLQTIDACADPIGIAYDAPTRRVWVACYGGALQVYADR